MKDPELSQVIINHFVGKVANLEEALRTSSAATLTKEFKKQFQEDRNARRREEAERRAAMYSDEGALDTVLEILSMSDEPLLPMLPLAPTVSSPVPTLSTHSPQALLSGSPAALSLQM